MMANAIVELFEDGGPIMWPLLAVAVVMVAAVVERLVFWGLLRRHRDAGRLEQVLAALENFDFPAAQAGAAGSRDPVLRMIHHGLGHLRGSLTGALQVAAGVELKRAGKFVVVIDTCITLAPLLGLLGTVTGIMKAFAQVTGDLAVEAVSAGIGEALIATAAGLAVAILGVVFLNAFNEFLARLQFDLETAATNVEVMVARARQEGRDPAGLARLPGSDVA